MAVNVLRKYVETDHKYYYLNLIRAQHTLCRDKQMQTIVTLNWEGSIAREVTAGEHTWGNFPRLHCQVMIDFVCVPLSVILQELRQRSTDGDQKVTPTC